MNATPAKANDLESRLISFAAAIVNLSGKLPRTPQGRHICRQILRSGTACAANYVEARGAESRADVIHKLKIVFKELNETTIWLEVIGRSAFALARSNCRRDSRGKPRTLSHYRRFYQDCSWRGRMM